MNKLTIYFIPFILTAALFLGCAAPINFSSEGEIRPSYVTDLDELLKKEEAQAQAKVGKGRVPTQRVVLDTVVPKPEEMTQTPTEEPQWVGDLKKEIEQPQQPTYTAQTQPVNPTVKLTGKRISRITGDEGLIAAEFKQPTAYVSAGGNKKVDIIFVVDASQSMAYYLRKVQKTFADFIPALYPLDWRIQFINAAHGRALFTYWSKKKGKAGMFLEKNGKILRNHEVFLTPRDDNHERIFLDTLRLHHINEFTMHDKGDVDVGTCKLPPHCHGGNEQPLRALTKAFDMNYGLLREGADVATVIITDSDEGRRSSLKYRKKPQEVISAFLDKWGGQKTFRSYGVIMVPGDKECLDKKLLFEENVYGEAVAQLSDLTNGQNYSLCDKSYAPLGHQIVDDFLK